MSLSAPSKFGVVWNNSDINRNTIPVASQIGITAGLASYTDGFPPLTMTPVASGGIPPFGQDFNGIFYAVTSALQWIQAGASYPYDSAFQTTIGGYPAGALVQRSDGLGWWLNTVANNTTAPESGGAGWVPENGPGSTAITSSIPKGALSPKNTGSNMWRIEFTRRQRFFLGCRWVVPVATITSLIRLPSGNITSSSPSSIN